MKKLDNRSIIVYTALGAVALYLLLLVTPSLGSIAAFNVTSILFGLLPVLVLAAVGALLFGSSRANTKDASSAHYKVLGIGAAITLITSVLITYISVGFSQPEELAWRFKLENLGVFLLFVSYAATLILMNRQRFVYWPFWNTKDKLHADEREKSVRNRVFEKAYRLNILLFVIAVWASTPHSQRLHDHLFQAGILCLLGLPSIVASWQKDS